MVSGVEVATRSRWWISAINCCTCTAALCAISCCTARRPSTLSRYRNTSSTALLLSRPPLIKRNARRNVRRNRRLSPLVRSLEHAYWPRCALRGREASRLMRPWVPLLLPVVSAPTADRASVLTEVALRSGASLCGEGAERHLTVALGTTRRLPARGVQGRAVTGPGAMPHPARGIAQAQASVLSDCRQPMAGHVHGATPRPRIPSTAI